MKKKFVPVNKIFLSDETIQFIKDNFKLMTNEEIAKATGLSKTYVRTYAYNLGLKRLILVNWTKEQTNFLIRNYRDLGNAEIADYINKYFPSCKVFTRKNISKKMTLLGLIRTGDMLNNIRERNRLKGVWGAPVKKKIPVLIKENFVSVDAKTRIVLKPGQTAAEAIENYKNNYLNRNT